MIELLVLLAAISLLFIIKSRGGLKHGVKEMEHVMIASPDLESFSKIEDSWRILNRTSEKNIDILFNKSIKILILGTYKVGKTYLSKRMTGISIVPPSKFVNTRGIYFLKCNDGYNDMLVGDSEGLFQPSLKAKPVIIREVILELTVSLADHIIFVIDKATDQELRTILQLIRIYKRSRTKSLTIIHNKKDFTLTELSKYKPSLSDMFGPLDDKKDYFEKMENDKEVRHLFLVNDESKDGRLFNDKMIKLLKTWINTRIPRAFVENMQLSLFNVLNRYYDLSDQKQLAYFEGEGIRLTKPITARTPLDNDNWTPSMFSMSSTEVEVNKTKYAHVKLTIDGLILDNVRVEGGKLDEKQNPTITLMSNDQIQIVWDKSDINSGELSQVISSVQLHKLVVTGEREKQDVYDSMIKSKGNICEFYVRVL